jgi:hypothetical protein
MSSTSSIVTAAIDISGTYTMTSAPATSTSISPPGARYTAFTGELLRVLREGVPGAGSLLTLQEIYLALMRGLAARSMPRPQHLGTGLAERVALGPNLANIKKGPAPPPVQHHAPASEDPTPSPSSTAPVNKAELEKQFHQAMVQGYQQTKRETGYNATMYIQMISKSGGLATARQLIHAASVSSGFTTLWEKKRLDLAVEAFVLQERWNPLFTDDERQIARDRLAQYGFHPE